MKTDKEVAKELDEQLGIVAPLIYKLQQHENSIQSLNRSHKEQKPMLIALSEQMPKDHTIKADHQAMILLSEKELDYLLALLELDFIDMMDQREQFSDQSTE